jgi:hypothetical protein
MEHILNNHLQRGFLLLFLAILNYELLLKYCLPVPNARYIFLQPVTLERKRLP